MKFFNCRPLKYIQDGSKATLLNLTHNIHIMTGKTQRTATPIEQKMSIHKQTLIFFVYQALEK